MNLLLNELDAKIASFGTEMKILMRKTKKRDLLDVKNLLFDRSLLICDVELILWILHKIGDDRAFI